MTLTAGLRVGGEGAGGSVNDQDTKSGSAKKQSALALQKYNYNPEQPRVPKANPHGGEWTSGSKAEGIDPIASDERADERIRLAQDDTTGIESDAFPPRRGRGHTWMPEGVYNKYKWKKETEDVFKNWTSGPLADPKINKWSPEHAAYNDAADELLRNYLKNHNMDVDASEDVTLQATPEQAKEIVNEVLTTREPRIRS